MEAITEALTFDDVLLLPRFSKVLPSETNISVSLSNEIKLRQQKIDSLPEIMRIEKINIHLEYDEWISSKDRGSQLMELHSIVKNNIKELQKK